MHKKSLRISVYVTDELLCDTVLKSKPVFLKEAAEILSDCNDYEVRVLIDILKAAKYSMRNVKMFEANITNTEKA